MLHKGLILFLFVWNLCCFVSGNNELQFFLGCRAVIPCQQKTSDSSGFKWFFMKDEHSQKVQILFQDKQGLQHHPVSHARRSVTHDRSLVISYFTEDDQGLYWCEKCYYDKCSERSAIINVKKEILDETWTKTVYVTEGDGFTHQCPGDFTSNWSFEAHSNRTASRLNERSIHILHVKYSDAGKYTCRTDRCGYSYKLFTINLCVITVQQKGDSSVSCALICDEVSVNAKSNTGNETIPLSVDPYGAINCSEKQVLNVNSTHKPSNVSNNTTGSLTESKDLMPVLYGTSAALACFITVALLMLFFRRRLWAVFPDCPCGNDDTVEDRNSVIYSSIVIRRPAKTTMNHMCDNECVYAMPAC